MGLYLDSGYLNFDYIMEHTKSPFIFIIGGRGTGKTYSSIKWLIESNELAVFMRRTQEETDAVLNNKTLSTASEVFKDLQLEMVIDKLSAKNSITGILEDDGSHRPVYISCSLTGVAGIRGFSNEDIKYIIYDEFIKELHKATMRGEGQALFNAYETFNRNRELAGKNPIRLICMANSNDVFNPIFQDFGILSEAWKMQRTGKHEAIIKNGLVTIYDLSDSKISERKKETVLYQLGNEDYNAMATGNVFEAEDNLISSENIKGYIPIASYGEFTIWNARGHFYITPHGAKLQKVVRFERDKKGRKGLLNFYPILNFAYLHDLITCENIEALAALRELFI